MVFSSFTFIAFFLPVVIILYFVSSAPKWRNGVLLAASLLFYAWGEPRFIVMMVLSILVNYVAAIMIGRSSKKSGRISWLVIGVCASLAFLFWFKYYAFIVNSFCGLFSIPYQAAPKTLPIGISFYTFQILTYTIEVYRGSVPPQKNLARLALYISFFPQLIAGPIVNYGDIVDQLKERKTSYKKVYEGLSRFMVGLGKKVIIANVCGEILSKLKLTGEISVLAAWLGAIAFAFQIYFDFSGYSDMAIGLGRVFGFNFLENFNYPYISGSVSEFWRRWHISLGSFFREYVYIPLGGNRVSAARNIFNLMVVWALTGAWHGASWNFIVWGVYYGVLLIIEKHLLKGGLSRLPKAPGLIITDLLVLFGWVIFYHDSLANGLAHLSAMFGIGAASASDAVSIFCLKNYLWVLVLALIASIPWKNILRLDDSKKTALPAVVIRSVVLSGVFVLSLVFLSGSSFNPFLYFRF